MNDENLSKHCCAISPNIFDAYSNPDLLLPLILGNLLSKRLWDLSARIQNKLVASDRPDNQINTSDLNKHDSLKLIRLIQDQINRHFKHLHPGEVAKVFGELDLNDERQRIGIKEVDRALSQVKSTFAQRIKDGAIPSDALSPLLDLIENNRFPAFYYANLDVVLANKNLTGRKSSAPMGLTSCLDEIAIFTALAMTMPQSGIESVIALTSASHYTAFGWMHTGEIWWFYGKNKLFSQQDWAQVVNNAFSGNAQAAFNFYFNDMDHIVSVAGTFDLTSGRSSIIADHIIQILEKLKQFFGLTLSQIASRPTPQIQYIEESPLAPILRNLLGTRSLDEAQLALHNSSDPELIQVLYSYRTIDVPSLNPYLEVARNQPNCKALGRSLKNRQEALAIIQGIEGVDSIFSDRNRIAMPDETLRLKTGSDLDKALLLHVLLEHMHAALNIVENISTHLGTRDTYVRGNEFCLSIHALREVDQPLQDCIRQMPELFQA